MTLLRLRLVPVTELGHVCLAMVLEPPPVNRYTVVLAQPPLYATNTNGNGVNRNPNPSLIPETSETQHQVGI